MLTAQIAEEKRTLLDRLARVSEVSSLAAAGVPEQCAKVRPAEGCWSALDVVEHITLSDRGMWKRYLDAGPNTGSIGLNADQFIQEVGRNRNAKRQAPEHVRPAGRFFSLAEALSEYRKSRGEVVAFCQEPAATYFREKLVKHPVAEMDGHQHLPSDGGPLRPARDAD